MFLEDKMAAKKRTTKRKAKEPVVETLVHEQPASIVREYPKDSCPDVEVSSRWFKIKLDDVNAKTIIVVGMILITAVLIVNALIAS
jgi:hypothetical protein